MEKPAGAYASGLAAARGIRLAVVASVGSIGVAIVGLVLVFWDEVLFAGPIIILVKTLGFWPGYVAFVLIWTSMNVASLTLFDRVWPSVRPYLRELWAGVLRFVGREDMPPPEEAEESTPAHRSWRMRLVVAASTVFRPLGAVSVGLLLGGPFGAPMYRFLGYRGLSGYLWTIALCPIFGIIWVPFYGAGGVRVLDFLVDAF